MNDSGKEMYQLMTELFPIFRSLTGPGVRQTLSIIKNHIPIEICSAKSGTTAFDWTVPKEWNIKEAYIGDHNGHRLINIEDSNLHVMGYSTPINRWVERNELLDHVHSLEDSPEWIPYMTSYYRENWGFCVSHRQKQSLKDPQYEVVIDSNLFDGEMSYGELVLPGEKSEEILLSTYVCHPSMANNELSGPAVLVSLAKWLQRLPDRKYSYRLLFLPETIGSIHYISKYYDHLRSHVVGGFVLTTIGDNRCYSFVQSRYGDSISDQIAHKILSEKPGYIKYSYLERGSDERQFNSPGVDLGVSTVCRSKFDTYPEYHTSADNMSLITPESLDESLEVVKRMILEFEAMEGLKPYWMMMPRERKAGCCEVVMRCEPQLGKRGLYPSISDRNTFNRVFDMMNFLAYADGTNTLEEIIGFTGMTLEAAEHFSELFQSAGLVRTVGE